MSPTKKRRVPRRELDARVGLLVAGKYTLAQAHEIGEGGLLLESSVPLKKDDRIVVTLRLPGILSGVVLATVIYQTKDGYYGLSFEKIEFDLKRKIRNYVASSTALQKKSSTDAA